MKTAADLKIGETGVVAFIAGNEQTVRRLIELGLTAGASITVKKTAPLGDPIELEVRGSRLSIRREQAQKIALRSREAAIWRKK